MEKEKLKKGFTLIELLAVIIILSLLFLGGGYLIVNYIQDAKNKAKDVSMNNIFKSAELYTKELYTGDFSIRWIPSSEVNDDEVNSGGTATITKTAYSCVTVKMLIDEGYLTKKTIKENDLNEKDIVKLTKDLNSNKIINKEYISKEEYSNFNDVCPGYGDITKPDIDVTVEKGTTYEKEKEATITISDSEGGFKAGTYKIKYGWSTQQLSCADMTDSVNIKVKQGDKEKNTKVTISGQNGAGKIYVCNESALIDVSGNTLSSGYTINNDMRLDNTGPEIIFSPNGNEIISKSQSTKITVKDKYDGKENNLKYKWSTTNTTDASDGQTFTNESSLSKINDTGRYYLCVYAEDSLGNKTNKCSNSFAVDNAKPSIPTYNAFFASDKSTYNQGTWTDKQVHTTISTTYSGIGTIYMQYILTTDYEKGKDWSNFNFSAGSLSKNGTTYTGTEPWGLTERNQSYYFRACVKETEICSDISSKYTIMYDLTSPSSSNGGLTYTAYHPTDGNKEYKSGDLTNKLVYTKITAKDDRSGISKIQYISKSSFNASNPNNGWRDFGFGISKLTQNGTSWTGTEEWSLSDRNDKYYIRACDKLNHCPTSISDFVEFNIYYDITKPSKPIMNFVYSNWNKYNGEWTNQTLYAGRVQGSPAPSSTDNVEVSKYQISKDGSNWIDYNYDYNNEMYQMSTSGTHKRYFRACDTASNCSESTLVNGYIDKGFPNNPTIQTIYDIWGSRSYTGLNQSGYSTIGGENGKWITASDPYIYFDNVGSDFSGITGSYVKLGSPSSAMTIQTFYATSSTNYSGSYYTNKELASGETELLIPFNHSGSWTKVRYDIGTASNLSYIIKATGILANANQWNRDDIYLNLSTSDVGTSGIKNWQYTYNSSATDTGTDPNSTWVAYTNSNKNTYITNPAFASDMNKTVYVRVCDNANNCSAKVSTEIKIDKTVPSISLSQTSNTTVTANITENNSVVDYYWTDTKQNNYNSINWTSSSNKTLALSFYGSKLYYLYVKDIAGNVVEKTITTTEVSSDISISINKSKNSYGWYLEVPTITIETTNPKVGNYYNYTITGSKNVSKNNIASSSTTTISDLTNGEYQLCVTSYNSEGKDEKKKCEDIKIDTTNPSSPTISLSGNTITISSSDSNVTYKYSTNGGTSYTTGSSFTLTSTTTINAKAVEISGRESSVNTKTLTVNNATNITPNTKYQCSSNGSYYDTSSAAKSACSYTGTTYYQCTFGGTTTTNTNYNTVKNACTATGKRCLKCDYTSNYSWLFEPDYNSLTCSHTIDTVRYFYNNPNVSAPTKSSDCNDHDMSIGGCFKVYTGFFNWGDNDYAMGTAFTSYNYAKCSDAPSITSCVSGYERSGEAYCSNYYAANEAKCAKDCRVTCSKTVSNNSTYVKYIYLDGVKDNNNASGNNPLKCSEMNYDYRTNTSTRTNTISTKYSCTGSSSNLQSGSTCYHSTSTKYYCSHTNSYYSTLTQAQSACSNICNSGTLYSGKCYKLS